MSRRLGSLELGLSVPQDMDAARVGLADLGCGGDCGCADCQSASAGLGLFYRNVWRPARARRGLGLVAPDTTPVGTVVSTATGAAAGALASAGVSAAGALVAGASLGSVAGPIGTVVGAAVGYLTSKLFGHADYASIYSQVSNSIQLAQAYLQVAGTYPGRVYGWLEMQYIWSGLVHYGIFPQNYGLAQMGECTEASISHAINACGTQSWINDLVVGSGTKAIQPQIDKANRAGLFNPSQIWSQYVEPVWDGPVECSGCVDWFLPKNARAGYGSLVQQLVIDTIDAIEFNANDCLGNYYGNLPADWQCGCASGCGNAPAPAAAAPAAAPKPAPTPAMVAVAQGCSPASVAGASIAAGGNQTLCDPSGNTWSFGQTECNTTTCAGFNILLNGQSAAKGYASTLALIDGNIVAENVFGTAVWVNGAWQSLTSACVGAPSGYSVIGNDTAGNPVYESPSGVLYECQGKQMVMFAGDLNLASGIEPAQALQAAIQGFLASGQSITQATQNAIASIQAQGSSVEPEAAEGVAQQVAMTAAAPSAVPAATIENSSSTSTDVLYGAGAIAAAGLVLWLLTSHHRRRR